MVTLIIGYPDSGKSKAAEELIAEDQSRSCRIYLATMIPFGEEGAARVAKHRAMREGLGFRTIEMPFDVAKAADRIGRPDDTVILLECVSNLAANEMFERGTSPEMTVQKTVGDIRALAEAAADLVIVSNHFETEESFDEETALYAEALDRINAELSDTADRTIILRPEEKPEER